MQSQYELEPCPFCEETEMELHRTATYCYISCSSCDADGPPGHTENDAVARWNKRGSRSTILHHERWTSGNMLILTEYEATITPKSLTIVKIQSDTDTHAEVNRMTRIWPLGDRFTGQLNTKTAKEAIRRIRKDSEN